MRSCRTHIFKRKIHSPLFSAQTNYNSIQLKKKTKKNVSYNLNKESSEMKFSDDSNEEYEECDEDNEVITSEMTRKKSKNVDKTTCKILFIF